MSAAVIWPLRTDINEARNYFLAIFHNDQPPNARVLDKLFSHVLISHELFERMSKLFQGLLRNLGTSVSGDEKLFHCTGDSCHIMVVPSKPSRIGLWMYQLVAQLGYSLPFLIIHMRMMAHETVRGERAPEHGVVRAWRDVIVSFSRCILVFDSYYFSADSVNVLEEPLASAVRPTKFPLWVGRQSQDSGTACTTAKQVTY